MFGSVERFYERLDGVKELLTDAAITSARLVVNPERVVVAEARRTFTYLSLFGYSVDAVVANRLLPDEITDPWFDAWKRQHLEHLATIEEGFAPVPVLRAELAPDELVGVDRLRGFGAALYGDADPAGHFADVSLLELTRTDAGDELVIELPFASKGRAGPGAATRRAARPGRAIPTGDPAPRLAAAPPDRRRLAARRRTARPVRPHHTMSPLRDCPATVSRSHRAVWQDVRLAMDDSPDPEDRDGGTNPGLAGVEQLQRAALEAVQAARAVLDVAESMIREPAAVEALVQTVSAMARTATESFAGFAAGMSTDATARSTTSDASPDAADHEADDGPDDGYHRISVD